jgi:hypothetical protein
MPFIQEIRSVLVCLILFYRRYGLKNIERFFFAFYIIIIKVLHFNSLERRSYKQLNNLEKQYEIDSL